MDDRARGFACRLPRAALALALAAAAGCSGDQTGPEPDMNGGNGPPPDLGPGGERPDARPPPADCCTPDRADAGTDRDLGPEEEICNGRDDDGDGESDEGCDDDGDGYCDADMRAAFGAGCIRQPADCDDDDPDIGPGAPDPLETEIVHGPELVKSSNSIGMGEWAALCLEPDDSDHLAWYFRGDRSLRYATNRSGAWEDLSLFGGFSVDAGSYADCASDPATGPWISFHVAGGAQDLSLATNEWDAVAELADWIITPIDGAGIGDEATGQWTSIVTWDNPDLLEPYVAIAHYRPVPTGRAYLTTNFTEDGAFHEFLVDGSPNANAGQHNSIALHPVEGYPCIAYYDATLAALKYGCAVDVDKGVFRPQTLADGGAGRWASLGFSREGHAYIAYYDEGNRDLRVTSNENDASGEVWDSRLVDGAGGRDAGQYASLAVSPAGRVHVAYHLRRPEGVLAYTFREGGAWQDPMELDDGDMVPMTPGREGDTGLYADLALDSRGCAHIAYHSPAAPTAPWVSSLWIVHVCPNLVDTNCDGE